MYLIQTVANTRPRVWTSYTDVHVNDEPRIKSMNSVEEIATYRHKFIEPYSHNTVKTAATTYDFPEHPPTTKKDKKWTFLGSIFRRKKKDDSDSSSDEETQKKNLNKKKRKPDKRKSKAKPVGTFDHIVVPTQNRASYVIPNGYNMHEDTGILSDPSGGFGSYIGRPLPRIPQPLEDKQLTRNETHHSHNSLGSADSLGRKSRRERTKLRAAARRDSTKQGSSSDEDSQRSYSSSRFRSDDSLTRQKDGSMSRRSRTARTDRYVRRLSKDDESILNREAMLRQTQENWHLKLPEERAQHAGRSSSRSPIVNNRTPESYTGVFTIPPSHTNPKFRTNKSTTNSLPAKEHQIEMQHFMTPQQVYCNTRSLSLEANMHKSSSPENPANVMHVQLPLGKPNLRLRNLSLVEQPRFKQPPPPPPRDPRRVMPQTQPIDNRPMSYSLEKRNIPIASSVRLSNANRNYDANHWHVGYRTTSEDQLPTEAKNIILAPRPASVTNETRKPRFLNRHTQESTESLQYLTEKKPRSRKPIFIQSTDKINTASFNQKKAEPQISRNNSSRVVNFWKPNDVEVVRKSSSPQMFTSQTRVHTNIFLPSVLKADLDVDTVDCCNKRESSPFKPISSPILGTKSDINGSVDSLTNEINGDFKRKSTNLEEALDELEAIYKSLRLGDEDLLERAEEREMSLYTQKRADARAAEAYPIGSRGTLSDSSFSYEPFDALDTPRRKKILKKAQTLDRKNDDMAYRKMSKERANTINNPMGNVSYLLTSPIHCPPDEIDSYMDEDDSNLNEPDITLDDVVYRAFKHANNSLKVIEPQPAFGIPIGPISPAPNSDYLHATPENTTRYQFTSKKIPDIVNDDLAFRNLRKDSNKEPALKPGQPDDLINNNNDIIKKKRAVRSLSANISNLIHRDADNPFKNYEENNENNKANLTDIADAMQIARQILKEKETRISATKRAFLSDSETKYRKLGMQGASSTETITESRLNFLNEMRSKDEAYVHCKPPRGSTPDRRLVKESTPIPSSPNEMLHTDSHNSSFEDLLTALAVEARETSDRITNELKILDDDLNKKQVNESKNTELSKKLSEIDAVSEHAKLCEKLLECVVESTELIASTKTESTLIEQVEHIDHLIPESVANIVTTRMEEAMSAAAEEVYSASEHDYENMGSDAEFDKALIDAASDADISCKSPFEEHRAELIASFKELDKLEDSFKAIDDASTDEELLTHAIADGISGGRRYRKRGTRNSAAGRSKSCGNTSANVMSEMQETRAERVARYKEERRRQLAAQFQETTLKLAKDKNATSSSSEGPRTTRASRLRAAAATAAASTVVTHEYASSPTLHTKFDANKEKAGFYSYSSPCDSPRTRAEKDKSSKRKSHLNRSLTSEEVISDTNDDDKTRRRRRRFFPTEVLHQSVITSSSNEEKLRNDASITATATMPPMSSLITAPGTFTSITSTSTPRKSELSIHMENARKGITSPSFSEMGKHKNAPAKKTTSNKTNSPRACHSDLEFNYPETNGTRQANKENIKRKTEELKLTKKVPQKLDNDIPADKAKNNRISKRMDELTARTRETLARVEKLVNRTRDSPARTKSPKKDLINNKLETKDSEIVEPKQDVESNRKTSVYKRPNDVNVTKTRGTYKTETPKITEITKKVIESNDIALVTFPSVPVSILKRKVSQDDSKPASTTNTPPVTFSPNVIEPTPTNRKQGILKKRRSLDESQVLRHRSCSPDVANKADSRSCMKTQRRSSLEEITRLPACDSNIQGILKRKTSRNEEDNFDNSLNSPQGILKRRSGASSAGSTTSGHHHHVSITTAVILAAAEGAEMILDSESVKPILKKKSFSDECNNAEINQSNDHLKPILKKKSSTDTDDSEERPKQRPILKLNRPFNDWDSQESFRSNESGSECDLKPSILKSREEPLIRQRLSFCDGDERRSMDDSSIRRRNRHSYTMNEFQFITSGATERETDRDLTRARVISVSELVMSFEKSTGAIPKKPTFKRNNDRCRTQPITFNEVEASLHFVQSPQREDFPGFSLSSPAGNHSVQSLLDLTTTLENECRLNNLLSKSVPNTSSDSCVAKMSSDSAFQSLGDGLELEEEEDVPKPPPKKIEPSKLEIQMKAIAEEAKNKKLAKANSGIQKYRSRQGSTERINSNRFATQPITYDEVLEAGRINKEEENEGSDQNKENEPEAPDPSKLSLSERIKLFNQKKTVEAPPHLLNVPKKRSRFVTQPITSVEVEKARFFTPDVKKSSPTPLTLDEDYASDHKGILKPKPDRISRSPYERENSPSPPRVMHRFDISPSSLTRTILKPENPADFPYDEGISSNDSDSDSSDAKLNAPAVGSVGDNNESESARVLDGDNSVQVSSKSSGSESQNTSDESSGGLEIQSIIGKEAALKRRQIRERAANEGCVQKSKSHALVGSNNNNDNCEELPAGVKRSMTTAAMRRNIGELKAKLQQNGDNEWRKRLPKLNNASEELNLLNAKNLYNDTLSEKPSILRAKKDELDASAKQWKSRVEKPDAVNFSVAGRMPIVPTTNILTISTAIKTTPKAKRFKGKEGDDSNEETSSTPVSPELGPNLGFKRSVSVHTSTDDSSGSDTSLRSSGRKVAVNRPDDDAFKSFFKSVEIKKTEDHIDVTFDDFDCITRQSESLLVQRKNVQVRKKRGGISRNPIKALAARSDIQNEYTEIFTGVAERESKRLIVEKLAKSSSHLAIEALAGLASKEDYASVALKKASALNTTYPPFKNLMLLHIKGRRHVQTRLVEPLASSINQGDNYILVTSRVLYNYIGTYSNVIEQSRAADIINHIQQSSDLGCKVDKVITIQAKNNKVLNKDLDEFWKLLGADATNVEVTDAGHPDEDEVYESKILETNMIYGLDNNELVPVDAYWGGIPKIEMLEPSKVFVFDYGSEMYVWSGKNAKLDEKKQALKLAKDLWELGYNYSECSVCPLTIFNMIGARENTSDSKKSESRPDWALFAKITQHRETILFREKFLDWPDYSRVIRVKDNTNETKIDASIDIKPCDAQELSDFVYKEPDFEVEGTHLGRGRRYYDEETNRQFEISTLGVTCWAIFENTYEKLENASKGHFYDGVSYIVRWQYSVMITGRELGGKPSKHSKLGRDRCVYFYWLGKNASINEKGAAAILTVELDSENSKQIRVTQGSEPPAFLQLFDGNMVIHSGKRDLEKKTQRLYICRGELEHETVLIEVPCSMRSLRSRSSFLYVDTETNQITIWNGAKALKQTQEVAKSLAKTISTKKPIEFGFNNQDVDVSSFKEDNEDNSFLKALGEKRQLYHSLSKTNSNFEETPRMFYFSSISGSFQATEMLCPHRSSHTTPYPFLQSELYLANQPSLFLLDVGDALWLWQGWWPEREHEATDLSEQTGSGTFRWQASRRAAMQTAVDYWHIKHPEHDKSVPAYLVWAGLEPLSFSNLFPTWCDRDDIAEINIMEGKKAGDMISIEKELALLTRTTYPLATLLQHPLPEGVDPIHIEKYLSPEDFTGLLSITKDEFEKLPNWKKTSLKKEKGLF